MFGTLLAITICIVAQYEPGTDVILCEKAGFDIRPDCITFVTDAALLSTYDAIVRAKDKTAREAFQGQRSVEDLWPTDMEFGTGNHEIKLRHALIRRSISTGGSIYYEIYLLRISGEGMTWLPSSTRTGFVHSNNVTKAQVPDSLLADWARADTSDPLMMRIMAEHKIQNAKEKAAFDARQAADAAEEAYQKQLAEARQKGDLKTVAKLERAHQLVRNKQLQQAKKAREAKAFYGRQPPQRNATGSRGSTTQAPP